MTEANELVQKIYALDKDVREARLGTLAEELGGDLTGKSAPREVAKKRWIKHWKKTILKQLEC